MKEIKQTIWVTFLRIVALISVLLLLFSEMGSAESGTYTMSLRASSESVAPGDMIQLAVQVHNDGWPDSGEAEVAAFQATLDYDHNLLEYVSIEVPEGTIGDFSPERSMILGYGEGHSFQETLDCAVLTMKVSENAEGDIPIVLSNVVLGRSDATPLNVSSAGTLTLKVGNKMMEEAASGRSGNRVQAAGENGSTISGADSGQNVSEGQGTTDQNTGTEVTDGGNGRTLQKAASATSSEGNNSTEGDGSDDPASTEPSADGNIASDVNGNNPSTGTIEKAEESKGSSIAPESTSGIRVVWILIILFVVVAAAAGTFFIYRKHHLEGGNRDGEKGRQSDDGR